LDEVVKKRGWEKRGQKRGCSKLNKKKTEGKKEKETGGGEEGTCEAKP